ncbi:MAG TPA: tRNA (adenosine(37)-N6)-threonylcarbamoyltransferase complex ATPase subunit type 1 TsaE [Taishania sp.]|nr:tRNA (adenosine(37)-N6)-threonylcarbamoyltransferase complex ATPase subunit type 1 TsaE [Taishania sp.]
MQQLITNIQELPAFATQFLDKYSHHRIFLFEAEMGCGKTTFIQELLRQMGVENPNGSPTYSIVNEYTTPNYGKIYHFDLYRIQDEEEIYDIGIEDMLYDGAYCFIEWPQIITLLIPDNVVKITIKLGDSSERFFEIEP